MKQSKMLELVENLKVGEKVIIEQFEDHLFVEKQDIDKPNDNVNANGVDLSILNEEDWFYVETEFFGNKWLFKGKNILNDEGLNIIYELIDKKLYIEKRRLTSDKNNITLLRKATPEDLAPFFEKYPMYAPVKELILKENKLKNCDMNVDELKIKALLEGLEAENIEEFMRDAKLVDYRNYGKAYISAARNKINEIMKEPLFITYDGVEIFDLCQTVYLIHPKTFIKQKNDLGYFSTNDLDNYKLFYHESKADEYIWKNKKLFSYEDMMKAKRSIILTSEDIEKSAKERSEQ